MAEGQREVILIAGVEGGGVMVYGRRTAEGWIFEDSYADHTPLFLDEDPIETPPQTTCTWEATLDFLDDHRWHRLPPIKVHPEFCERVFAAVAVRLAADPDERPGVLERWKYRCGFEEPSR